MVDYFWDGGLFSGMVVCVSKIGLFSGTVKSFWNAKKFPETLDRFRNRGQFI